MMKNTSYFYFFVIICLSSLAWGEITINEVMYSAPDGDEWVEIYNPSNESVDLENWNLTDNLNTDELVCCSFLGNCSLILEGGNYAIITDQDTELYDYLDTDALKVCVDDNSIGNGLGNDEDKISLSNLNGTIIDFINYLDEWGADGNNKTLERNKKGEWKESIISGGTPGKKNSAYDFSYDYSVLQISEIMADPFGTDDLFKPGGEWVEIYNSGDEPLFLEGVVLYDEDDSNELYLTKVNVDRLELCAGCYAVAYRNGDSDFDLSKINDKVRLFTGYPAAVNILIDEVSFSNAVEGMSFNRFAEGWYQSRPTPGKENVYTEGCDWGLRLGMDSSIFQKDELDFKLLLSRKYGSTENLTVKGKIEDFNGEQIKEYSPWTDEQITTERSKSYSPNLKEGVYQISFWINGLNCNDEELSDNHITNLIAINPKYQLAASNLSIERSYLGNDYTAEWGDQFLVKVNIYKGAETKTAVELWAEKGGEVISQRSKLNIYDPYKDYVLTIPVQLEPNCNKKISDGKAKLILEGLGLREEAEFEIEDVDGDICKDYLEYVEELEDQENQNKESSYQIIDYPTEIFPGQVFRIKLQLLGDKQEHSFTSWGYLYRGSKCYSCADGERDSNNINFRLKENELKQVELLMKADEEIAAGIYNLKVKLNKDNQKTDKEITVEIYVSDKLEQKEEALELFTEDNSFDPDNLLEVNSKKKEIVNEINGIVIYESNSEKAKQLVPYLLLLVFGMVLFVLLRKH
ncbi:MAG: lamin tail domain-containing protein [Candidatus Woesearchaeota archaeon]